MNHLLRISGFHTARRSLLRLVIGCAAVVPFFATDTAAIESTLDLRLFSVDLQNPSDGPPVTVRLQPQERCVFGDLDSMVLDSMNVGQRGELLASLEPLRASDQAVGGVQAIKLRFDAEGKPLPIDVQFRIPAQSTTSVFGLFVCLSTGRSKSCRDKPLIDYKDVLAPYRVKVDPKTGLATHIDQQAKTAGTQEKLYFFRPLILTSAQAFVPSDPLSQPSYNRFQSILTRAGISDAQALTTRAQQLGSTLGSLAPVKDEQTIVVRLPYYGIEKCQAR